MARVGVAQPDPLPRLLFHLHRLNTFHTCALCSPEEVNSSPCKGNAVHPETGNQYGHDDRSSFMLWTPYLTHPFSGNHQRCTLSFVSSETIHRLSSVFPDFHIKSVKPVLAPPPASQARAASARPDAALTPPGAQPVGVRLHQPQFHS